MKKINEKNAIILTLLLLIITIVFVSFPISNELTFEKEIFEWVDGVEQRKGTLIVDGVVTRRLISNLVTFEGDIKILELHDQNLRDVKTKIELKKKGIVTFPLVRLGIYEQKGGNVAINESIGVVRVENIFDNMILFPVDESSESIELSNRKFWAENYEQGLHLIQDLENSVEASFND